MKTLRLSFILSFFICSYGHCAEVKYQATKESVLIKAIDKQFRASKISENTIVIDAEKNKIVITGRTGEILHRIISRTSEVTDGKEVFHYFTTTGINQNSEFLVEIYKDQKTEITYIGTAFKKKWTVNSET